MLLKKLRNRSLSSTVSLLAVLILALALKAGSSFAITVTPAEQRAYNNAVADAQIVTQDKIFSNLLAVVPDCVVPGSTPARIIRDHTNKNRLCGSKIVWNEDLSRVLVVTFLDRASYEKYYKPFMGQEYVLQKSLWVTVVPEMKNFFIRSCAQNTTERLETCPPTAKRIHELLGINPQRTYEILVEMWVDPKDLFRPSADPEITDHESDAPRIVQGGVDWVYPSDSNPFLFPKSFSLDLSQKYVEAKWDMSNPNRIWDYKSWFEMRIFGVPSPDPNDPSQAIPSIYKTADGGWPWTQLGYTYDWGNPKNHVGLSEFVIRLDPARGGQVTVKLERAIDSKTRSWRGYFRCWREPGTENPRTFPSCPETN